MDSSSTLNKLVLEHCDTFPSGKYLISPRRTHSFSSSSSSLSPPPSSLEKSLSFHDDPLLLSPAAPPAPRFSGVPFSWEHFPGVPKNQNLKKKQESSLKLLPLPPPNPAKIHSSKRLNHEETKIRKKNSSSQIGSFQKDPFFAALVECSKDGHERIKSRHFWNEAKVSRSVSDRFGLISTYASCKRTCAVSESIIYLPSSRRR